MSRCVGSSFFVVAVINVTISEKERRSPLFIVYFLLYFFQDATVAVVPVATTVVATTIYSTMGFDLLVSVVWRATGVSRDFVERCWFLLRLLLVGVLLDDGGGLL